MNGAIIYATRYGSTAQYADWIADATGLPVFEADTAEADPSKYDFVVLGCPVIYHKLSLEEWVRHRMWALSDKPVLFFTVSGAPAGEKLDGWIADSLPKTLIDRMEHFALRGRQNPKDLTRFDRMMLIIGGLKNRDPTARREEMKGFDYMDKGSIAPIVKRIQELQRAGAK